MSSAFKLSVDDVPSDLTGTSNTFFWPKQGTSPWFTSNVGPNLGELGRVNDRNIDFVRIASAVLSADRSVLRSGLMSAWNTREISIDVDVIAVEPWLGVKTELENLLGFLTGDTWTLKFSETKGASEQIAARAIGASRVVLFSGGADSGAGAILSAHELQGSSSHALVSHFSEKNLAPLQRKLKDETVRLFPNSLSDFIQVHHSRGRTSPEGKLYKKENSTRSRSILFIAIGLAVASVNKLPLWIPENGYASINPPLSSNRRGSLSTKTTHPAFLQGLVRILGKVGAHNELSNPFADLTKGEMFTKVSEAIGVEAASNYLSATTSCSHTGARSFGLKGRIQCGVCFGCVLRKASFAASSIPDQTQYLVPAGDQRLERWLESKLVVPAMRDFLSRDLRAQDLATLRLPNDIELAKATELCNRAMAELRSLSL